MQPQAEGQAVAEDRPLRDEIYMITGGFWADELYHVLWAYQTTQRISIEKTPFNLVFETEAVIPIEIGLPSPKIEEYNENTNSEWLQTNLVLIEESRKRAVVRMASCRQRMAKCYNFQVKSKKFRVGDLVLQRTEVSQSMERRKLSHNWKDSYQVDEMIRLETYKLRQLDGTLLQRSWNSANLRIYY
ncbi:uncharacterized protein [Elaeis guineensis]|uniref:uncharacterized protein n=1 Tax=Elaeis guineensis var. tenera TaxID=51953 RepID=UPI003C6D99F1